jgi:carboxyl-terminal processing protease
MKKIACTLFFATFVLALSFAQAGFSDGMKKVLTTMNIISQMYVDKVDDNKLAEDAVKALISELDPHSSYMSKEEVKESNEPLEGNFTGIGISFNMITDTLYVIETIAGGPSAKVGILAGDRILLVNDSSVAGVKMPTKDIMRRLRGAKGTEVNVKVLRRGVPELLNFKIIRDKIPIYSVDAAYMVDGVTGYIKISRFGATTYGEFKEACLKLREQGMKNVILDLEGNGGGYLSAAIDLANEFLPADKTIVYTEGSKRPRYLEKSKGNGFFQAGKVVVLVDEGSASASEIFSGAIQDWDRGVIVGRRTFGKGLVQQQIPLPDESMIRLTIARYYTPTGRCIQKPYVKGDRSSYDQDLISRFNKGELTNADSIHFPDSLKYRTLVTGRTVYGGGGIMPDYFVPIDTTSSTALHRSLYASNVINKLALKTVDEGRSSLLAQFPSESTYLQSFQVTEQMFATLRKMAETEKIKFDEKQFEKSKHLIDLQIKALMARDLYETASFYKVINKENDIFQKGVQVIENPKLYDLLLKGRNN